MATKCRSGLAEGLPDDTAAADVSTDSSLVQSGDSGGHNAARQVIGASGANRLEK